MWRSFETEKHSTFLNVAWSSKQPRWKYFDIHFFLLFQQVFWLLHQKTAYPLGLWHTECGSQALNIYNVNSLSWKAFSAVYVLVLLYSFIGKIKATSSSEAMTRLTSVMDHFFFSSFVPLDQLQYTWGVGKRVGFFGLFGFFFLAALLRISLIVSMQIILRLEKQKQRECILDLE